MIPTGGTLKRIYKRLYAHFGPQDWWPGDTRLEIIIGAILTQNTSWNNVEKAIDNLKKEGLLSSPRKLFNVSCSRLAGLIKPAGYYNVKAGRIRNFLSFLGSRYGFSLNRMSSRDTYELREELLSVNGIGPETCDSILLYAFKKPVFVVDAYTRRIFSRHALVKDTIGYDAMQKVFMSVLAPDHRLYNEYHALIVRAGKEFCRAKPVCGRCPLKK